jgi:hypothetical protein
MTVLAGRGKFVRCDRSESDFTYRLDLFSNRRTSEASGTESEDRLAGYVGRRGFIRSFCGPEQSLSPRASNAASATNIRGMDFRRALQVARMAKSRPSRPIPANEVVLKNGRSASDVLSVAIGDL